LKITGLELKPYAVREWNAPLVGEEPERVAPLFGEEPALTEIPVISLNLV